MDAKDYAKQIALFAILDGQYDPIEAERIIASALSAQSAEIERMKSDITRALENKTDALMTLKLLLLWGKEIRSYPQAMAAIGPMTKDRFDGAIFAAENCLSKLLSPDAKGVER